ncbi:trypsin-like peptidase domain-containing protein [Streptomyces sp. HNM0574]|uniref:trypsin-like peptidase domain-containing protein n=1 Tax=Streptomyces sp. HNM0574 TaxID=2714954 RepID=UPI00146AF23B|nr:trypsin-like peptidase domain-containing protein [Streptomyces sp. HNM0574]NLU67301.1 PDZ domain-containing protein [Streptomyces sp. HNM0574]
MDEGNDAGQKPKWWSRPRRFSPLRAAAPAPSDTSPDETQPPRTDPAEAPGGDAALPTPREPAEQPEPPASAPAEAPPADAAPAPERQAAVPLHGADPYGTPPYGGPGPWAPAPLVQRPSATPPHGTPAGPVTTPAYGTPTGGGPAGPVPQRQTDVPQQAAPARDFTVPGPAVPPAPGSAGATDPGPLRYDPWAPPGGRSPYDTAPPAAEQPRGGRRRKAVTGAALLALVAGLAGGVVGTYAERHGGLTRVSLPQAPAEKGGRSSGLAGVAAGVLPGVVTIHTSGRDGEGTGTGFVLDDRGHILTNNHVVGPAGEGGLVDVTFQGGQTVQAEVLGQDQGYDLAVVKVSGVSGLTPLPLGNSDSVRVGDPAVAVGAPFGLEGTVTTGIISAKGRPITAGGEQVGDETSYVDALQTDAPINPGNSGGPLVDTGGRVIGVNSAIRAAGGESTDEFGLPKEGEGEGGSVGLGFAIPVNQAKRVAEELINDGEARHPVLGVTLDPAYEGDGARIGGPSGAGGAVEPDSPADEAGLKAGDVVTAVDGERVHSAEELTVRVRSHLPGEKVSLTLRRGESEKSVRLTLGSVSGG